LSKIQREETTQRVKRTNERIAFRVRGNGKKVKWRVRKQARIGELGKERSTHGFKEKFLLSWKTFPSPISFIQF
jgi:hypothetical protein